MDKEFSNVLKYEFYSEKMINYHDIVVNTINHLLQFQSYGLISNSFFHKYWSYIGSFYTELLEKERVIHYKYDNMMDEIFDLHVDGDKRSVYGNYITKEKLEKFNKEVELFESANINFYEALAQLLDELNLKKRFTTDMILLKVLEDEFDYLSTKYLSLEEMYSEYEDVIDIDEDK